MFIGSNLRKISFVKSTGRATCGSVAVPPKAFICHRWKRWHAVVPSFQPPSGGPLI